MKVWAEKGAWINKRGVEKLQQISHARVKRILIIRHAALGDMLQTRPFLIECRKFFPHAEIVFCVISNYQLGAPTDLVDELVVIPGRDQNKISIFHLYQIYKNLGEFDLLLDMACTSRSLIQTLLTNARFKMGFPYVHRFFVFDAEIFRSEFVYEAELLLHFLHFLGHQSTYPLDFRMPTPLIPYQNRNKIVAHFLSSSNPLRNYPKEKFIEFIAMMAKEKPGHEQVIVQGNGPHEKFEEIFHELNVVRRIPNVALRPSTDLGELETFLANCCYLVANDTGVRHLGMALETPGVGLFSITIPYRNVNPYDIKQSCFFRADGQWPEAMEVFQHVMDHWRKIGL